MEIEMIHRKLENIICEHLKQGKVILLFGARQVGKTTLLENLDCLKQQKTLCLSGDETDIKELLSNTTSTRLKQAFAGNDNVVIDEAQEIKGIGTTLKLISDKLKEIQVIATGSSAFELANRTSEPLTGRKFEFMLYPLSFSEMVAHHGFIEEMRMLELRLIYGYYPEVVNNRGNEEKILKLIAKSYLYKDILRLDNIRKSELLEKILKALALQVGSEVSYNELAQLCGTNSNTVERYIDVLQKAYIIFKLPAFGSNVRNEIKKGKKIYFWDNGIRNAIINNFNNKASLRTDIGPLWENFLISERLKKNAYAQKDLNAYFWRTMQQQEVDYIEDEANSISAFEFKWNPKAKSRLPLTFSSAYKVKEFKTINPTNLEEFLLKD